MKIIRIQRWPVTFKVRPEFFIVSSAGAHRTSRYVIVAIETDDGSVGWGEATVVPQWSGETQGSALTLIDDYFTPMLLGRDPRQIPALSATMDEIIDNPFTKAAIEMALLDLAAKAAREPLYEHLGGRVNATEIPIKFSIGLREPEDAASIAAEKVRQGFRAIKVKVGPEPEKDFQRVAAVRAAIGPDSQLTIDVNGGWSVEQAIRETPRYAELGVAYVEQPTPRWDIEGMAKVRALVSLPVMADESVFAVWQAEQVIEKKAADLISIYPGKHGGVLRAMEIARKAQAAGMT
ncbi:MAG TPA: enolase C-terminal domain-like protein, partial [Clostridia bacterium]|nr:enolase C-terminal domain-like protein [Clostridia bacterium]